MLDPSATTGLFYLKTFPAIEIAGGFSSRGASDREAAGGDMNQVVRLWAFSLFFVAISAFGQRDLGTITGTITDPQGSAVPHAKVTITEDATGLNYTVETIDAGDYVRPALK